MPGRSRAGAATTPGRSPHTDGSRCSGSRRPVAAGRRGPSPPLRPANGSWARVLRTRATCSSTMRGHCRGSAWWHAAATLQSRTGDRPGRRRGRRGSSPPDRAAPTRRAPATGRSAPAARERNVSASSRGPLPSRIVSRTNGTVSRTLPQPLAARYANQSGGREIRTLDKGEPIAVFKALRGSPEPSGAVGDNPPDLRFCEI